MTNERYPAFPGPEDFTELKATVTFAFRVWNVGQRTPAEDLARKFQIGFNLACDELAEEVARASDLEVAVAPVARPRD